MSTELSISLKVSRLRPPNWSLCVKPLQTFGLFPMVCTAIALAPVASAWASVSHKSVRQKVQENFPKLRQCYTEGVRSNPRKKGHLTLEWSIDESGTARNMVIVEPQYQREPLAQCLAKSISDLKFAPAPKGQLFKARLPIDLKRL